jgi:hypothetical protein
MAKSGVFIQLCGWLGVWNLWTGAVSDSYYIVHSGILDVREKFVKADATSSLPFSNILDKGYHRCSVAAWQNAQYVLQP